MDWTEVLLLCWQEVVPSLPGLIRKGERGSVFVLLCSNRWGNEDTGLFPVQSPQNAERNSELQP